MIKFVMVAVAVVSLSGCNTLTGRTNADLIDPGDSYALQTMKLTGWDSLIRDSKQANGEQSPGEGLAGLDGLLNAEQMFSDTGSLGAGLAMGLATAFFQPNIGLKNSRPIFFLPVSQAADEKEAMVRMVDLTATAFLDTARSRELIVDLTNDGREVYSSSSRTSETRWVNFADQYCLDVCRMRVEIDRRDVERVAINNPDLGLAGEYWVADGSKERHQLDFYSYKTQKRRFQRYAPELAVTQAFSKTLPKTFSLYLAPERGGRTESGEPISFPFVMNQGAVALFVQGTTKTMLAE